MNNDDIKYNVNIAKYINKLTGTATYMEKGTLQHIIYMCNIII